MNNNILTSYFYLRELSAMLVMVRVSLTNPGRDRKKSIKISENLNIKKMRKFDHRDVEMEWQ